jgi:hypothetical protein
MKLGGETCVDFARKKRNEKNVDRQSDWSASEVTWQCVATRQATVRFL